MLDVAEHLPPVISAAQLFVGLGSTKMCCSRVVMAPGKNFIAHSGGYDQLLNRRLAGGVQGVSTNETRGHQDLKSNHLPRGVGIVLSHHPLGASRFPGN